MLPLQTVAEKYSPVDVSIILFTNEKILTVTTLKNLCNDGLYIYSSTKKNDIATKCLCTQLVFDY